MGKVKPLDIIVCADVLDFLSTLPDKYVQCVITSPPYWGLRDYGTATWDGGDPNCDHQIGRFEYDVSDKQKSNFGSAGHQAKDICPKCGAIRIDHQIGIELSPEDYVTNMVTIFQEIRRVLRDDGTVWLNLGDSYASNGIYIHSWYEKEKNKDKTHLHTKHKERYMDKKAFRGGEYNIKAKDLIGIPWRVALALQSDGWWLRSDIIWQKTNPMPESVRDRPTKSHEYIFLLTKSARYYYNYEAIKEPAKDWGKRDRSNGKYTSGDVPIKGGAHGGLTDGDFKIKGRNKRTVWTVPTQAFPDAHFAVFPEALIEPCILAGTKKGDIVFDPFMGAGTTAIVATKHGRHYLGCDLNPEYVEMANARLAAVQLDLGS